MKICFSIYRKKKKVGKAQLQQNKAKDVVLIGILREFKGRRQES